MKKNNLIQEKSFTFSLRIIHLYRELIKEKEFIISKQLLKSGTSIGANVEEAIAAQSRKDFISKLSISLKEARETSYWLRLLDQSNLTNINVISYIHDIYSIINILSAIVKTTKSQQK